MSYEDIKSKCGDFDMNNAIGRELVYERTRYVFNDKLEEFHNNFYLTLFNSKLKIWRCQIMALQKNNFVTGGDMRTPVIFKS